MKGEILYYVCVIAYSGSGSWSFGNDLTGNISISGVDNSSSRHSENYKKRIFSFR